MSAREPAPPGPPRNDPRAPAPRHHCPAWPLRGPARLQSWQQQQDLVNGQNVERARAISVAVRPGSPEHDHRPLRARHARPHRPERPPALLRSPPLEMLPLQAGWQAVRLVEPGSRVVVVNTAVPFGQSSALVSDDWVRAVRETKRPAVSSVRRDPATGQFFVVDRRPGDARRRGALRARRPHPRGGVQRRPASAAGAARRRPRADGRGTDDHGEDAGRGALPRRQTRPGLRRRPFERRRKARCDRKLLEGTPSFSAWSRSP